MHSTSGMISIKDTLKDMASATGQDQEYFKQVLDRIEKIGLMAASK